MKEKKCELTLKAGNKQFNIKPYQSPRGLRHEVKRPDKRTIDCYLDFDSVGLVKFIGYLQVIACSMEK